MSSTGGPGQPSDLAPVPAEIADYADQAVTYVQRALGIELTYDSETLSVLDHYLRSAPTTDQAASLLIAATCGAYFGEVIRRSIGGEWDMVSPDPATWRLVLDSGVWFSPAAMALAAIRGPIEDEEAEEKTNPDAGASEWEATLHAPGDLRSRLGEVLGAMAEVQADEFYTLCCRFDTLEHVESVLAAMRDQDRAKRN